MNIQKNNESTFIELVRTYENVPDEPVDEYDLMIQNDDHDCHAGPESGCRGCEKIQKKYNLENLPF